MQRANEGATLATVEELESAFLAAPDEPRLIELYRALMTEGSDHVLAGILDKIRPIQHRVTLIQADVQPVALEALSRDPHPHVRRVVAGHPSITEEVAFRLSEDQEPHVRTALRKNPHCHPFVAAAIELADRRRAVDQDDGKVAGEHLLECAWQARRCKLTAPQLVGLADEWLGVSPEQLTEMSIEQVRLLLEVLAAHLGERPMPRKPPRPKVKPVKPEPRIQARVAAPAAPPGLNGTGRHGPTSKKPAPAAGGKRPVTAAAPASAPGGKKPAGGGKKPASPAPAAKTSQPPAAAKAKAVATKPATGKKVAGKKPTGPKPAAKKPAAKKPASKPAKKPTGKPAAKKPTSKPAKKPASKPAAKKPASKKAAAKKPVAAAGRTGARSKPRAPAQARPRPKPAKRPKVAARRR